MLASGLAVQPQSLDTFSTKALFGHEAEACAAASDLTDERSSLGRRDKNDRVSFLAAETA